MSVKRSIAGRHAEPWLVAGSRPRIIGREIGGAARRFV